MKTMKVAFGVLIALMLTVTMVTVSDVETADAAEPPISSVSFDSDVGGLIIEVPGVDGRRAIVNASGQESINGNAVFSDGMAVVSFDGVTAGSYDLSIRVQGYTDQYRSTIDICELTIISGTQSHSVFLSTGDYTLKNYSNYGFQVPEGKEFGGWMFDGTTYQPGSTIDITPSGDNYTLRVQAIWNDTSTEDIPVESVTIDQENPEVTVDGSITLTATVMPEYATDRTVTWASEDPGIATVDPVTGEVTGVSVGTATITATAGGITTSVEVSVIAGTIAVTGVTLNTESASLTVGQTLQLSATVQPTNATNRDVTWSASNGRATVDRNGLVTAVSAGEVVITVTTDDGGFTATCTITVEEIPPVIVDVTGVTLDKGTMTLYDDGVTGKLTATVSPSNATNKDVVWSSSDEAMVTVVDGVVTPVSTGTATITVMTVDGSHKATCTVTVKTVAPDHITVVPDKTVYEMGESFDSGMTVTLVNNNGSTRILTADEYTYTTDFDSQNPGRYTVTVEYGDLEFTYYVNVRAPGQVAITVNVVGGGLFGGATLYWDGGSRDITAFDTVLVDEGTQVTLVCSGLFAPTVTVDGQIVDSEYTFTADRDMTFMVAFPTEDDDDEPVNPPVVVPDQDDDSTIYIVAVAAGAVVAILAALILMQARKS